MGTGHWNGSGKQVIGSPVWKNAVIPLEVEWVWQEGATISLIRRMTGEHSRVIGLAAG